MAGGFLGAVEIAALESELGRRKLRPDLHRGSTEGASPSEVGRGRLWGRLPRCRHQGEQLAGECEQSGPAAVGQQAELPDTDETSWQHMLDKAPQKLRDGECHLALLVPACVVLPTKSDALAVERQQAVVADRDAVRIAAQITKHLLRSAEGRLGVYDPVLTVQGA